MGTWHEFRCEGCNYHTTVSGKRDVGMVAVTNTVICRECSEVVDVLVGAYGKDGPTGDPGMDRDLHRCPNCHGRDTDPWPKKRPCPKCGKRMEDTGDFTLWD
jgi:hypothetical protein